MNQPSRNVFKLEELKKSVLLLPAVLMLTVFFILPIVLTVYDSFTNLALSGSNAADFHFVGLDNYKKMVSDPNTFISIGNTVVFLAGSLAGQSLLGFMTAYLMKNKSRRFRRVAGPCILAGWIMPEIVVALCCSAFFNDEGTLNLFLKALHIPGVEWLYRYPMLSVILANIWHGTAFSMMNFQSALDNVPSDIEEAARVDGAGRLKTLVRIVLPCIRETIATNTMLNTLSTLGVFGLIYAMTGGGPGVSTLTLPIFMYRQAFNSFQLGYGTAIAMLILLVGVICSFIYAKLLKSEG